jgi:uncharacterized BrkB/YihY/UPF0761 family membrane protein
MRKSKKQKLGFGESLLVALPFVLFLVIFAHLAKRVDFSAWPPKTVMRASLWLPVIFTALTYLFVVMNLHSKSKGEWSWRDGLVAGVALIVVWLILQPVYEMSMWSAERNRLGLKGHP